jgi:CRP-like cAMP-binding protein
MNLFDTLDSKSLYKKEYFTNEIVFKKEDLCSSICLINRGKIALMSNNKIIHIYNSKGIIGLDLIFSHKPFYQFNYLALELTSLTFISKDKLLEEMKKFNTLLVILELYSNKIINLEKHVKLLSYQKDKDKVIHFLLDEYKSKSSTSFVIGLTKVELSNYLNIEKATLSKIISELINDRIIANQNKLYTIIDINYFENY